MNTILEINKLVTHYPNVDMPILICNDIVLHRAQVYFVIGKSGIGKSTFLESLGLMSNTIQDKSNDIIYHDSNSNISLKELWGTSHLPDFRANNYAFIFQENNLMEHFTAGENMAFGLLQSGMSLPEAKGVIMPIMKTLNLPESYFDSKVRRLSGGERQRIAFIRAITASFSILFCDEPTGNLDPNLAEKLIKFLKTNIKRNRKTAIIVSHDIDLAMEFADQILIIRPAKESKGFLSNSHIIRKEDEKWYDVNGVELNELRKFLRESIR